MRKNIQYIAVILALGAMAVSCNKSESIPAGDELISYAPQVAGTKAMVDDEAGLQAQTFAVKDIVDGELYVDNTIVFDGGWRYTAPADAKYLWKNGSHKLFGYTAGMGAFAGTTLTVPAMTLTSASVQNDLLYSDIVSTTADAWKAANAKSDPVPLHFHHLLSAVSLGLVNYTGSDITVNSLTVSLPNQGGATVSFAGAAPVVAVGTLAAAGNFHEGTTVALPNKDTLDVFSNVVITGKDTPAPRMVWPGSFAKEAVTVTVNYTAAGETAAVEKTLSFPEVTWNAGEVNTYNILLYPDKLDLIFEVQPWQSVDLGTVDTKNASINMSNVTWMNTKVKLTEDGEEVNTLSISGYSVYMYHNPYVNGTQYNGYYPAQGYFTVNYPTAGKYRIGIIPAYGEDTVDASKYEIYVYDNTITSEDKWVKHDSENGAAISHDTIYFQVRAAATSYDANYKAQINIWFQPAGSEEWISAYSEIRANYACVITNN